jgi:hypothetical protein
MAAPRRTALRLAAALPVACALMALVPALPAPARAADAPAATPALPAELAHELVGAQALGTARMRFLGLDIYEARLWTSTDFKPEAYDQSLFALELVYFRAMSGRLIAERSLKEMRRQGGLEPAREQAWLAAMVQAFPDVQPGDRITGLHLPGVGARFWSNGQSRPSVRDTDFSRLFFGIWLSEATSEPLLRKGLLGHKVA